MKRAIYFYWGNEVMSYMRYMTLHSFCHYNPNWRVVLIENSLPNNRTLDKEVAEKQDKTEYEGENYYNRINDLPVERVDFDVSMLDMSARRVETMTDIHIKDMLNWKLLSEGKGVVADMDILFIKPIEQIIQDDADVGLVCFKGFPMKDYIPVSFMYAAKENTLFKHIYKRSLVNYHPQGYQSCGTPCIKYPNLNKMKKAYPQYNIQQLHEQCVFPFAGIRWLRGIDMLWKRNKAGGLDDNTVGLHWYGGAPLSQEYNNKVNHTTVHSINNTITSKIKEILNA